MYTNPDPTNTFDWCGKFSQRGITSQFFGSYGTVYVEARMHLEQWSKSG